MARQSNIPNIILSYIIPSWDLVSMDDMRIENESEEEILERDKIYLKETSYDAIIAAFNEANIPYTVLKTDITITFLFEGSNTNLKVGDIIKSINDVNINSYDDLSKELMKYSINDKIKIKVLRDDKIVECYAILFNNNDKPTIGIGLSYLKDITTNPSVEYILKIMKVVHQEDFYVH
jgi:PDZ domain-containing protein